VTLEVGYIWQPTITPYDINQYRAAAEHIAAEQGAVIQGEPTIIHPENQDGTEPPNLRSGTPLLRWTTIKQEDS
jgi:hypothetical protein